MRRLSQILAIGITIAGLHGAAQGFSNVSINGQRLTTPQLAVLQLQLGSMIPAGDYLVDQSGCWLNTTTGARGCPAQASGQGAAQGTVDTHSRYGSGEVTSDGSWNHYSNSAGMGVGGTSDGCIYTTSGWSNC